MAVNDWMVNKDPQGRGNFHVQQEKLKGEEFTIVRYFDCVTEPLTSGDDYKAIKIGAGVLITDVIVNVVTVEGAADTIDIGDASSATAFHSNLSVNSAAITQATTFRKYYAAASDVRIHADAAITAAQFYLIVKGVRLV